MRKKLIIDGHNLLFRAHWAFKKNITDYSNDNQYIIYVFLNILKSYVRLFEPSEIIICWDTKQEGESNSRKEIISEYKAQRPNHDNVFEYLPQINEILKTLGVKQIYPKSYEADDIMYWLCAKRYPNECILVTTDSDLYQIIIPELSNNIFYNPKCKTQINSVFLKQKYSVNDGREYIIKKALRGDIADNISGIKGIRQTRIDNIIECLGTDFDFDALKKSKILNDNELEIFERNLKVMKLDEVLNHEDEISFYESELNQEPKADKNQFKELIKKAELWIIYRKLSEWFYAFQPKDESNPSYLNIYSNVFY